MVCTNKQPNCYESVLEMQLYPGQEFSVSVVAVGQLQGTTPGTVYAEIRDDVNQHSQFTTIPIFQASNLINGSCTELIYTPRSENQRATLVLSIKPNLPAFSDQDINEAVDNTKRLTRKLNNGIIMARFLALPVHVAITFQPCPLGFQLRKGSCICTEVFQHKAQAFV